LDDFTAYDLTTFATSRPIVIDLETHFCTVNPVSRSITISRESRESRQVVSRDVVPGTLSYTTSRLVIDLESGFTVPK